MNLYRIKTGRVRVTECLSRRDSRKKKGLAQAACFFLSENLQRPEKKKNKKKNPLSRAFEKKMLG